MGLTHDGALFWLLIVAFCASFRVSLDQRLELYHFCRAIFNHVGVSYHIRSWEKGYRAKTKGRAASTDRPGASAAFH
ncbi:hypothetical protein B0T10DRAFT_479875 [Thelonectria olida]|uniref:Secreted protein n=1 Tax=Thelonectria olida TaxID=1576542 RepID=A0A9P8W8P6_9HYPO|nr:hypothetical protein B0T10DRAFT_479875 [Thelonectria olida]